MKAGWRAGLAELRVPGGAGERDVSSPGGHGCRENAVGEKAADYPSAPGGGLRGGGGGLVRGPGGRPGRGWERRGRGRGRRGWGVFSGRGPAAAVLPRLALGILDRAHS